MGCNCGGDSAFETVWELRVVGKPVEEHSTQMSANTSRAGNHDGHGMILKVRKRRDRNTARH